MRWLANLDRFESMIAPVGDALLARVGLRAGERVVDIGCGGGATSREIARRVQPGGTVVGVDISAALVAEAARRSASAGLTNAAFVVADAAAALPAGAPFDRLVSRFGSMFFANPAAAFHNLGRMLRTGARADFAVWAPARARPVRIRRPGVFPGGAGRGRLSRTAVPALGGAAADRRRRSRSCGRGVLRAQCDVLRCPRAGTTACAARNRGGRAHRVVRGAPDAGRDCDGSQCLASERLCRVRSGGPDAGRRSEWWSRRELNPRPQALDFRIYARSCLFGSHPSLPEQQGRRRTSDGDS